MEIKKNDILGFVRNVEKQMQEKKVQAKNSAAVETPKESASVQSTNSSPRLHKVMARALEVQKEIRLLQTEYSRHQSAVAFVKNNSEQELWQEDLKKFLKSSFRYESQDLPDNKEEFIEKSAGALSNLKNEILKKEVVMQNIFAVSSLDGDNGHKSMQRILSNLSSLKELVLHLNTFSVKKLTES